MSKAGRPTSHQFRGDVVNCVLVLKLASIERKVDAFGAAVETQSAYRERAVQIVANAAFTLRCIQAAALAVQKLPQYHEDPRVCNLKLDGSAGKTWASRLMKLLHMAKHSLTSGANQPRLPADDAINEYQLARRERLKLYEPHHRVECDEMAVVYEKATDVFGPVGESTAGAAVGGGEKARRVATAMLGVTHGTDPADPDGRRDFPVFIIIKGESKTPHDLTKTRVLQELQKSCDYFKDYELKIWEGTVKVKVGAAKTPTDIKFRRPYLVRYGPDGVTPRVVITVQRKAWMDTVTLCLWYAIVVAAVRRKVGAELNIGVDQCSAHMTSEGDRYAEAAHVTLEKLLANCTPALAVKDVGCNHLVRGEFRKQTTDTVFLDLLEWRREHAAALARGDRVPRFSPPMPSKADIVMGLLDAWFRLADDPKTFGATIDKALIKTGVRPGADGEYKLWTTPKLGRVDSTDTRLLDILMGGAVNAGGGERDDEFDRDADGNLVQRGEPAWLAVVNRERPPRSAGAAADAPANGEEEAGEEEGAALFRVGDAVMSDMTTDSLLIELRQDREEEGLPALTVEEEQQQRLHDLDDLPTPYPATVTRVYDDGFYDLLYTDGSSDTATHAPAAAVWSV